MTEIGATPSRWTKTTLGRFQARRRNEAMEACQTAIRELRRVEGDIDDLQHRRLTQEGTQERADDVAQAHLRAIVALQEAVIALMNLGTEETGPPDETATG